MLIRDSLSVVVGRLYEKSKRLYYWECLSFLTIKKKVEWMDFFHCMVVVSTHCKDTFICKHHIKVNFASDDPFNVVMTLQPCKLSFFPHAVIFILSLFLYSDLYIVSTTLGRRSASCNRSQSWPFAMLFTCWATLCLIKERWIHRNIIKLVFRLSLTHSNRM